MKRPNLRELQRWLRWIITDPRGAEGALKGARPGKSQMDDAALVRRAGRRYVEPKPRHLRWVAETPPISRARRLDIYAEAYFARLVEGLAADFEATRRILGENAFRRFVADYLKINPSTSATIADLGMRLPAFARSHRLSHEIPYLRDLLRLEGELLRAFYADDAEPMNFAGLEAVSADAWSRARFRLDPSIRFLRVSWPVVELWRRRQDLIEGEKRDLTRAGARLLVFRGVGFAKGGVDVESLDLVAFAILRLMSKGASLGEIHARIEAAHGPGAGADLSPHITRWVGRGILRGVEFTVLNGRARTS